MLFIFRALVVGLCVAAVYYSIYLHVDDEDVSSPVRTFFLSVEKISCIRSYIQLF